MAGRCWRLLISLSTPTTEAAAVDSAHSSAGSRWWLLRSSEASFVATALQPKARPAPTMVMFAWGRPNALSMYGTRLAKARPTSTRVIVSSSCVWEELRGGAHSPAPTTPSTIAAIATYS